MIAGSMGRIADLVATLLTKPKEERVTPDSIRHAKTDNGKADATIFPKPPNAMASLIGWWPLKESNMFSIGRGYTEEFTLREKGLPKSSISRAHRRISQAGENRVMERAPPNPGHD